jgi:hypothetical protein
VLLILDSGLHEGIGESVDHDSDREGPAVRATALPARYKTPGSGSIIRVPFPSSLSLARGELRTMSGNRIRRYDSLWTAQPSKLPSEQGLGNPGLPPFGTPTPSAMTTALGLSPPSSVGGLGCSHAQGSLFEPPKAASVVHGDVPPGFAIFSLAHLSPAERQAVDAQRALYQQAYDLARQAADEKLIRDWMI